MKTAYCLDLDGTVTLIELLPAIAADIGLAEELDSLTRATMQGVIDFPQSLRLRAMLLGMIPVPRVREIVVGVPLDEDVVRFLRRNRNNSFIVTGNLDIWVTPLIERLECEGFSSRAAYNGERLEVRHVLNKGDAVKALRERGFQRVVAVGDGMNDLPMFEQADISIAYGGVHAPAPGVIEQAEYVIHDGGQLCKLLEAL